jgi:phosphotriesterase-related protein
MQDVTVAGSESFIRTVCGDIHAGELGVCYPHEHLFGAPPSHLATADFILDDEASALRELAWFRAAGGRALVEMSTVDYNRDALALQRVAQATGVYIIAATGFNKDPFSKTFVDALADEALYELLRGDVTVGIDDTGIRAGVLKASSTLDEISSSARRVFDAVARVHLETGAPISTHTEAGTMALEQIRLLRDGGVPAEHIVIGHLDRRLDAAYLLEVAQSGVYLGFDQISKEKYHPDRQRIEHIVRLITEGHGRQILLSGDLARRSYWPGYGTGGGPGFTYLLWRFVPWLRKVGVEETAIQDLIVHNPARALSFDRARC